MLNASETLSSVDNALSGSAERWSFLYTLVTANKMSVAVRGRAPVHAARAGPAPRTSPPPRPAPPDDEEAEVQDVGGRPERELALAAPDGARARCEHFRHAATASPRGASSRTPIAATTPCRRRWTRARRPASRVYLQHNRVSGTKPPSGRRRGGEDPSRDVQRAPSRRRGRGSRGMRELFLEDNVLAREHLHRARDAPPCATTGRGGSPTRSARARRTGARRRDRRRRHTHQRARRNDSSGCPENNYVSGGGAAVARRVPHAHPHRWSLRDNLISGTSGPRASGVTRTAAPGQATNTSVPANRYRTTRRKAHARCLEC